MGKILVDGVLVDEIDEQALRAKLLKNIEYIKLFDKNFSVTQEEIDAMFSPENKNLYYRVKAAKQKLDKSRVEAPKTKIAKIIDRSYFASRNLEDNEASKEENIKNDEKIQAATLEGDEYRKEFLAEYFNKCMKLDPKMLDLDKLEQGLKRRLDPNYKKDEKAEGPSPEEIIDYYIKNLDIIETGRNFKSFDEDAARYGFDLKPEIKVGMKNLYDKAEVVPGYGRTINDLFLFNDETFFTVPIMKMNADLCMNIMMNIYNTIQNVQERDTFVTAVSAAVNFYNSKNGIGTYIEPDEHQFNASDFENTRPGLLEYKKALEKGLETLVMMNDGSEFFKSERYENIIKSMEAGLKTMSTLGPNISDQDASLLKTTLNTVYAAARDYPDFSAVNAPLGIKNEFVGVCDNIKNMTNGLMTNDLMLNTAIHKWNEIDSKELHNVSEMKRRSDRAEGLDQYNIVESIQAADKKISWERVTPEKDMKVIKTYSMALGALKQMKAELETTDMNYKKNSKELRDMYTELGNTITALEGKTAAGDANEALWKTQMQNLSQKVFAYIDGKNNRLANYGTSERSVKRYEIAVDLLKLSDKAGSMKPAVPSDCEDYRRSALEILNQYDEEMKNLAASRDSREFKRLQNQVRYTKALMEAAATKVEAKAALIQLQYAARDYYLTKIDQPMRGTRPAKIDIARRLEQVGKHASNEHFEDAHSERENIIQDLGIKIMKQNLLMEMTAKDAAIALNAKKMLRNPSKLMDEAGKLTKRSVFTKTFADLTTEELKKLNQKSAKDIQKMYINNIPRLKTGRSIDAKMDRILNARSYFDKQIHNSLFATAEEKAAVNSNKFSLKTSRSALDSLAIGLMLKDGVSVDDALDPTKLQDRKREYGIKALGLIKTQSANAIADAYITGTNALADYLEQKYATLNEITLDNMLSEEYRNVMTASYFMKDMTQEVNRANFKEKLDPAEEYEEKISQCMDRGDSIGKIGAEFDLLLNDMIKSYSYSRNETSEVASTLVTGMIRFANLSETYKGIKQEVAKNGTSICEVMAKPEGIFEASQYQVRLQQGVAFFAPQSKKTIKELSKAIEIDNDLGDKVLERFIDGSWKNLKINFDFNNGNIKYKLEGLNNAVNGKVAADINEPQNNPEVKKPEEQKDNKKVEFVNTL